jgi:cytosine/adenosine deaminase-related metal-dependent hydrolase
MNYKLLTSDWILTCDDDFTIIKNGAIVFEDTINNNSYNQIIDIGSKDDIVSKYPNIDIEYCGANSVLMPGLINAHTHLEFSANTTTLKYGNFLRWLNSVISNREELVEKATTELIDTQLKKMLQSGTTTIAAISSYSLDINSAINSDINVVYFIEAIGSKADMIDALFADFKAKLNTALENRSDNFIPAIAIHSPYSVHPILIKEVLQIAKEKNLSVSSHFQESDQENRWLNYSDGEFSDFFNNFLNQSKSLTTPKKFLEQFKNIDNLSFTHCAVANKDELNYIKKLNGSVIHCPKSNRLLTNNTLDLEHLENINLALGTDGLSSNNSLNLFYELRTALFLHTNIDLNKLCKKLLLSATNGGAKALGLNKGILAKQKDADIISFCLPNSCEEIEDLATMIILHTNHINKLYIQGKQIELF